MKKYLIGFGVLCFIGVILFFGLRDPKDTIFSDIEVETESDQQSATPENSNPSPLNPVKDLVAKVPEDLTEARKVLRDEGLPMGATSFTGPRPLSEEEMDKMDQLFESYEEGWDKKMREVMINELGLSEEDYGDYLKMRDGYEEDRLEAFEEFHKKMAQEKGPHYSYSPTQEMMDFDGKLRKEYLDLYRKRFGESAFVKYYNALDSYNTEIREKADPKFGVLTIEF
ncbi:MAG: hypothetical protein K9K67_07160 [Bacteriovoracaceae bacterium]|nr:hypothetical protein [Bacteriovoracaceae bacterium]